jgi:FMN-dependent NADH-azoreductase
MVPTLKRRVLRNLVNFDESSIEAASLSRGASWQSLLYVTCNLKPTELSFSLSVGKEFPDAYLRQNPDDEVYILDLTGDNIQRIDADVLSGWGKMCNNDSFASLTFDEQRKIGRI